MHKSAPVILWLRQDLRLADNPALHHAIETDTAILPVFILDDKAAGEWAYGSAQRVALHHALEDLSQSLEKSGAKLVLRKGDSFAVLQQLIKETNASEIFWNRRYEEWAVKQDIDIKENIGIPVQSFNGKLLCEPWQIKTGSGGPYKVFTPYWRNMETALSQKPPHVYPALRKLNGFDSVKGEDLKDWKFLPTKPDWSGGIEQNWQFTEAQAHKILQDFINDKLPHYSKERDFPHIDATSRLSPYLALGKISPKQIWHEIQTAMHDNRISPGQHFEAEKFLRQIVWREFSYHLLFYYPHTATKALYEKFDRFPWRYHTKESRAWQKGQTGYPLVDAGMRQLWQTGWMHNRVRLVTASFLVKHLLLSWQEGSKFFWDTLVDADLANNTMGWQWVAGSGADAAPYFRIFNPVTQSEKFDAEEYIREFVPELAAMPDKYIHFPAAAPKHILEQSGVVLGKTYPKPIVEHKMARERALEALKNIR